MQMINTVHGKIWYAWKTGFKTKYVQVKLNL